MDTFKQQTIDANRARKILANIHDRLRKLRRKTNEDYLRILLDEINKYFATLDTSAINTWQLPSSKEGPQSKKHNDFINTIVTEIDSIHAKQKIGEDLLTKAVNYMMSERTGIMRMISNVQERVISHKLRNSTNDRRITSFTEYFNDMTMTDLELSKNAFIDPSYSALTIQPITKSSDNSKLIDPSSIKVTVELDKDTLPADTLPRGFQSIYPLCNQTEAKEFTMGYGRTLSKESLSHQEINLTSATDGLDEFRASNIQSASLKDGFSITDDVIASAMGDVTHGEFEMVWNDFRPGRTHLFNCTKQYPKASIMLLKSMVDAGFEDSAVTIDPSQIIMDYNSGFSFNGANIGDNNNADYSDLDIPTKQIKKIAINFKLKEGLTVGQTLSKIHLLFAKPLVGGWIPEINYGESSITLSDGSVVYPFVLPPNSIQNKVAEARSLMLSTTVLDPREFHIVLNLTGDGSSLWESIPNYRGAYWRFHSQGSEVMGTVSTQDTATPSDKKLTTNTGNTFFIYHDLIRTDNVGDIPKFNILVAQKVASVHKAELT